MSFAVIVPRFTFGQSEERCKMADSNAMAPDYEDFQPPLYEYDPFFTAHVSTSMRVPDRIAVAATTPGTNGEGDAQLMEQYNIGRSAEIMNVPDRIVVAGQERHIGLKEDLKLNLDFDPADLDKHSTVAIQTPPRVLTLQDRPFPSVDDPRTRAHGTRGGGTPRQLSARSNGVKMTSSPSLDLSMSGSDGLLLQDADVDDAIVIRRQLLRLTRRLMHLEEENNRRSQREMVLYPVIIGYVLFQFAKWFLQNN